MEMENKYASRGVGGTALGLAIGALGVEAIRGGFGGILGGGATAVYNENMPVNRYELNMVRDLTSKDMEIAYLRGRDESKTDDLELYKYIDGHVRRIDRELADQRVFNATTNATVSCLAGQVNTMQTLLGNITKTVIPNSAICPGYGDVTVTVTPASTTTT